MVLLLSGFWPSVKWLEKPDKNGVYIICANHTSMVDIMLTLAIFPNCFLFIGKKELAKLPLFGYFYKRTNLLVDRKSLRSRIEVFERGAEQIDEGKGLCIYPEGGVPDEDILLAPFKSGAFRLAAQKDIPIIPVSYLNNKEHMPYDFKKGYPGVLKAVVHPFIIPKGEDDAEIERMKELCFNTIFEPLNAYQNKKELINEIG
jgi:1-acyl-sn-glycerol-3-phosphate acyltransferase